MGADLNARKLERNTLAVYPIIDIGYHRFVDVPRLSGAALRGGATIVQLRHKGEDFGLVAELVEKTRGWIAQAGIPLIINDRLDVALALGAQGVHLGQSDMAVKTARAAADHAGRGDLLLGVSVTTVAQAERAMADGADYLSVSPLFGTATKPDLDPPAGLEGLRRIRAALPTVPLVAIGGIRVGRVAEVIGAGADGVAFISAMDEHPEQGVRAIASAVRQTRASLNRKEQLE